MFKTKHHCLSFELFRSISVSTRRDIVRKDCKNKNKNKNKTEISPNNRVFGSSYIMF